MDKNIQKALELLTFAGILSAPVVIHNTVGQLPFLNYEAISELVAKIKIDNENITRIYGIDLAERFQSFFVTGLILANIFMLLFCLLFLWQLKKGTFSDGFGRGLCISKKLNRNMLRRRLMYSGAGCLMLFLLVWFVPFLIFTPNGGGLANIMSGIRGQFLVSILFVNYSYFTALVLVAGLNFRRSL